MKPTLIGAVCALAILCQPAAADHQATPSEKVLLQATMQKSIMHRLVDGKFYYFNEKSGVFSALYPAKTHPMILQAGKHFVLCTSFRDTQGKDVYVDFYVARRGTSFVVFETRVDDRAPLHAMMKAKLVRKVD